jgi:paraquat-inducible protein B
MTETPNNQDDSSIPEAVAEPKRRFSLQLVWLIPIVAAIIGGTLAVRSYLQQGPTITISFKSGDGLEAGKTKIKFKDVEVGLVTKINISKDLKRVIATAELVKEAAPYLVDDTRFWVVRPRISGGSVTGLGTLMGGSYISIDVGRSKKTVRDFRGLESAPVVTMDEPGSRFKLHSQDLGSLDNGSPLYFRRMQVGQVLSYELDRDGKGVTFTVFVAAPYDRYVKATTRFWHASGVDVAIDANGVKVNTQSLVSIMVGGIAFQTPDEDGEAPPPDPNMAFTLNANREEALKQPESYSMTYTMVFNESVRGLSVGAPVDFRGVIIGEVTRIRVEFDNHSKQLNMLVEARVYPLRMISRSNTMVAANPKAPNSYINQMVTYGLRAQLKSGNLVTGQLLVSLDFFPRAPRARINWSTDPPRFPTTPSSLVELEASLGKVMKKVEKLPLDAVVGDVRQALQSFDTAVKSLDTTMKSTDQMVKRLDSQVVTEARSTLEDARKTLQSAKKVLEDDAPLQQDLRETLRELSHTARSLRVLSDQLERHPESLISGKPAVKGD